MRTPTTEARRHGERSGDLAIVKTGSPRRRGVAEKTKHLPQNGDTEKGRASDRTADSDQGVTVEHTIEPCHPERVGANAGAPKTRVFRVVGWSYAPPSRRTPTKTVPEHAASGSSYETLEDMLLRLTSALQTLRAALREIFDESAYDRFLLRTHAARSVASYRVFTRERDAAMATKPRCC